MEPMYVVTNKYTYEEHKKILLHSTHATSRIKRSWLCTAIVITLFYAVTGYFIGYDVAFCGIAIGAALMAVVIMVNIKKSFYEDKLMANKEETIRFYKDFLEAETTKSLFKLTYDNIKEIWETKTNFYITHGFSSKIIILKENCTDELIEFIRTLKK